MATNNSINLQAAGLVTYSGAGVFSASTFSQHYTLVGGSANSVVGVAPGTVGQALVSGGASADPAYGTLGVAGGGTGLATLSTYELLASGTTATGTMQQIAAGSSGQFLVSNGAGALPSFQSLSPSYLPWSVETGATVAMDDNNGYIADAASGSVTFTLPVSSAVGDIVEVAGLSGGSGWIIDQLAGQSIQYGVVSTTTGTGGSLSSSQNSDCVRLVCSVPSADWVVLSSIGNLSYV